MPFAVSVAPPADHTSLTGSQVRAADVALVARWNAGMGFIGMHTAVPGADRRAWVQRQPFREQSRTRFWHKGHSKAVRVGTSGSVTRAGTFTLHVEPTLDRDINRISTRH